MLWFLVVFVLGNIDRMCNMHKLNSENANQTLASCRSGKFLAGISCNAGETSRHTSKVKTKRGEQELT